MVWGDHDQYPDWETLCSIIIYLCILIGVGSIRDHVTVEVPDPESNLMNIKDSLESLISQQLESA